ncbi:MAG: ribosomal protein S18-alanine N-acetyltransferase [Oscillospiraceae bacterium]
MIIFSVLSENDLDEIMMVEKVCFPKDAWTRKMFESELCNNISFYIVARDEDTNELIAYGGVWLMYDVGDITNIAVSPLFRHMGIAMEILKLLTDICRENHMKSISLEVRESNISAQSLYRKMGFKMAGTRKKYYENTENALIMTKDLEDLEDLEDKET